MAKTKIYTVYFWTKKGLFKNWAIDVNATSQKAAIEQVKSLWYNVLHKDMHMFNIYAEKSETLDYRDFELLYQGIGYND